MSKEDPLEGEIEAERRLRELTRNADRGSEQKQKFTDSRRGQEKPILIHEGTRSFEKQEERFMIVIKKTRATKEVSRLTPTSNLHNRRIFLNNFQKHMNDPSLEKWTAKSKLIS